MLGELEITSAIVLEKTQGQVKRNAPLEKEVMLQIQYEEGNGRTFLNGQLVVKLPHQVADQIRLNRPIEDDSLLELIIPQATQTIYEQLTADEVTTNEAYPDVDHLEEFAPIAIENDEKKEETEDDTDE